MLFRAERLKQLSDNMATGPIILHFNRQSLSNTFLKFTIPLLFLIISRSSIRGDKYICIGAVWLHRRPYMVVVRSGGGSRIYQPHHDKAHSEAEYMLFPLFYSSKCIMHVGWKSMHCHAGPPHATLYVQIEMNSFLVKLTMVCQSHFLPGDAQSTTMFQCLILWT